jgi:hypothetical protein
MNWQNKLDYFIKLDRNLAKDKHFSLFGLFVSYGENEVLIKRLLDSEF